MFGASAPDARRFAPRGEGRLNETLGGLLLGNLLNRAGEAAGDTVGADSDIAGEAGDEAGDLTQKLILVGSSAIALTSSAETALPSEIPPLISSTPLDFAAKSLRALAASDRKSTRLNSSHRSLSRMPSSA